MKLTNVMVAAVLVVGAGLVGCKGNNDMQADRGDPMYQSNPNTPGVTRGGGSMPVGSQGDAPAGDVARHTDAAGGNTDGSR